MNKLVQVALLLQERDDAFLAPHRPVMLRDLDFGLVAVTFDRIADIARPQPPVADLRAADRVEVVHVVGRIFRHI